MDASTGTSRYGLVTDSGSAHWYGRDGSPQHHTNIKGAKRHGYYPSVTSYLKVWPKPALDRWKIEQAIMSALTLPRKDGEADDAFAKRVAEDMGEEARSAARIGTDLHGLMNVRLVEGKWPVDIKPELRAWAEVYEPWIASEITETIVSEKVLCNKDWGYAGTVDLIANTRQWGCAVLDFKNQNVRDTGPAFYDEWLMQLFAYAAAWDPALPQFREKDTKVDNLVSLVLDRNKPAAPYVKVWPADEWMLAWEKFKAAMQLWCLWKEYDPIEWHQPVQTAKPKPKKKATQGQIAGIDAEMFLSGFKRIQFICNSIAHDKGWWEGDRNKAELIALMHSELSEGLEYLRHRNPNSDHIPGWSGLEEEFADVIIRIMDFAQEFDLDIAGALITKAEFNMKREHKHGGKAF